ncbi:hypothetical protein [Aquipuribacter hungaricus]|uniref:Mercuric ion transport protein n=1 Tax=Aquipuribacter hungaricus TaxID=545624 RepID=A0ABV7WG99_9MICO
MTGQGPIGVDGVSAPADRPAEPTTSRRDRRLVGGAAAACAVCCAPPVLGLLGIAGGGLVATAATLAFAGLAFAVVVAALSVVGLLLRRRALVRASHVPRVGAGAAAGRVSDLGMPERPGRGEDGLGARSR